MDHRHLFTVVGDPELMTNRVEGNRHNLPELTVISGSSSEQSPTRKPERMREIDLLRAAAICLMALTHGIFHMAYAPSWAYYISQAGVYFCYAGFLMAFALAQGVTADSGAANPGRRRKRLIQLAGFALLAYYCVALGAYKDEIFHHSSNAAILRGGGTPIDGSSPLVKLVRMATLLTVPKAGDYFLCFVLFLVVIAIWPKLPANIQRRPVHAMAGSFMLFAGAIALSWAFPYTVEMTGRLAPIQGWWLMTIGLNGGSRVFPLFTYAPLLTAGIIAGGSYLHSSNRQDWLDRVTAGAIAVALITALLSYAFWPPPYVMLEGPLALSTAVLPGAQPGILYLVGATAWSLLVCALFARMLLLWPTAHQWSVTRFLTFAGQNSLWIIVWQYVWIVLGIRILHPETGATRASLFLVTMVLVPPFAVYALKAARGAVVRRLAWSS